MFSSRWYVWYNYGSITGISSLISSGICESIIVVNGKIQYFVKGQIVKPNEYYKFRSDFVARKNV